MGYFVVKTVAMSLACMGMLMAFTWAEELMFDMWQWALLTAGVGGSGLLATARTRLRHA